jgi:hypothetical protein
VGFHVDSGEQRERARRAEQRLLEHSQQRRPQPRRGYQQDEYPPDDPEDAPPPVFKVGGQFLAGRDPSTAPDKYAARFRDGLPPPPPPETPLSPQLLRGGPRTLVPQELLDGAADAFQGTPAPSRFPENGTGHPQPDPWPVPAPPSEALPLPDPEGERLVGHYHGTYESNEAPCYGDCSPATITSPDPEGERLVGIVLEDALSEPDYDLFAPEADEQAAPLSRSQRKRLARKRRKIEQTLAIPEAAAHTGPAPHPTNAPDRLRCDARARVRFPDGTTATVTCPLTPFPHPGQPHIVRLQPDADGTDIFVGFWLPGE